ncbi:MAG: AAA family ATPase [Clostridia bacterium]|nr:AAA family ATPase [Clostridia bacterium]
MAEKILIASGKGGVGKSTVTSFFGREFAVRGSKVLLIDADPGLGALDIMLGVQDRVMNTWLDVVCENCEGENALVEVASGLFLLPSPSVYPDELTDEDFRNVVSYFDNKFDIIFIDASAGIDRNLEITAGAADRAVFVATADEVSVRCAAAAARESENYGIERKDMRLVINRFEKKAAIKSKLLNVDGVIDKSGVMLLGIIPEDKKIPFMSVTSVMPKKKSPFIKAVGRITGRINGEYIPLEI